MLYEVVHFDCWCHRQMAVFTFGSTRLDILHPSHEQVKEALILLLITKTCVVARLPGGHQLRLIPVTCQHPKHQLAGFNTSKPVYASISYFKSTKRRSQY